jgi:hypothetical protein
MVRTWISTYKWLFVHFLSRDKKRTKKTRVGDTPTYPAHRVRALLAQG